MDKKNYVGLREEIRYLFPTFKVNIQRQPDPVRTVMETAVFFYANRVISTVNNGINFPIVSLRNIAIRLYSITVMKASCIIRHPGELVYPRFFVAVMSVLLELGIIRAKKGNWLKRFAVCFV